MKKLFLLSLFITLNTSSLDPIETAIKESDPDQLAVALKNKVAEIGPLSDRQIAKYLDFAEKIIEKRADTKWWDRFCPDYQSGKAALAAGIFCIGLLAPIIYIIQKDEITRHERNIMHSIQGASAIVSIILFAFAVKDINAYKQKNIQLYENALEIKQMIYSI